LVLFSGSASKIAGFGLPTLVAAEPGEARGGAQFPELGLLLLGDAQGFAIQLLSGLGMPLPLQQLTFVPIKRKRSLIRTLRGTTAMV
jgi:hypothetical protein